jgi:hypothetical protein
MFSNIFIARRWIAVAALTVGCVILPIAWSSPAAQAESLGGALGNAVGGAARGTGGALGGLGGSTDAPAGNPATGNSSTDRGGAGGSETAGRSGNWVGAPADAKTDGHFGGQYECGSTLIDWLSGRDCMDKSPETPDLDQASYSAGHDAAAPEVAPQSQAPAAKTVTTPQTMARLNVEEPAVEKPKLTVAPQPMEPKAGEGIRPRSSPLLSCGKAKSIVDGYGFTQVRPSDCDGQVFAFDAKRDGKSFSVSLNAQNGELIQVRKLPPKASP